jgi:hypothetical protein
MVTGGRSLPWREVEKTCVRSGQVRGVGREIFLLLIFINNLRHRKAHVPLASMLGCYIACISYVDFYLFV